MISFELNVGVFFMNELISVVIPVYNVETYLDACVRSVMKQTFIILYVGRIIPEKGISELIEAINIINNDNVVLLLIGAAKFALNGMTVYEKKVKELIEKSSNNIIQLGYIKNNELYKYQNIADIAVIPTIIEEAAPLACVENMAAGLPIIITNSGGMPEYAGKKCSIIVEKDANLQYSLAKQIKDLIENKDKRKAMGRYAELEATNYSITNMYNEFYKTLKLKVEKNNEVNKDKA